MNSETAEIILEYAKNVKAIVKCQGCLEYYISAANDAANKMVYARAINAWKVGRFLGTTQAEIIDVVKGVLQDNGECPRCSSWHQN